MIKFKTLVVSCVVLLTTMLGGPAAAGAFSKVLIPGTGAVTAMAVKPGTTGDNAVVFAGFDGGGIYRSTDGGATWNRVGTADASHLTTSRILQFAFDPNDVTNNTIMAVGRFNGAAGAGGAYKSTDGGSTWTLSSAGLPASPVVNWITYSKGTVTNAVFVAVDGGTNGGVYKSTDNGAIWIKVYSANANVSRVIADSNDATGQTLYAGHTTGVAVTTNGGTTWS